MTPHPELVNATLSICMRYTHTWSWVADSWTIAKMFKVKLDYSEYLLRGAPSTPPAFREGYALVSAEME